MRNFFSLRRRVLAMVLPPEFDPNNKPAFKGPAQPVFYEGEPKDIDSARTAS
jgi:hypothetical protein